MGGTGGSHIHRGVLEDILYHGASSRCHVRTDDGAVLAVAQAEPAARRRCRRPARAADFVAQGERVPLE